METARAAGAPAGRRAVFAWCLYDWANSAFPTVISTFLFSTYFTEVVAPDREIGTALWGYAMTAAAFAIAIASPVLGAIADQTGRRKPWLLVFSLLTAFATAALWFARPEAASVPLALVMAALATFGFEVGTVFYNAMLPDLAPPGRIGRISGWAWGLGYFGGLVCLMATLLGLVQAAPPPFGLDAGRYEHVRAGAIFVALWFVVFALPLFLWVPDRAGSGISNVAALRNGLAALIATLRRLPQYRNIARFLLAKMIYVDGLNTLFTFGGIYAAGTFGMSIEEVLVFGILLNVTAGAGAALFAWVDDWIGAKRTVMLALGGLIGLGAAALLIQDKPVFYAVGLGLGIFFGPAQAASRSLMGRLAPPALSTEFFGLYALAGKATAFVGPALFGWATLAAGSQRAGMATILVFFVAGLVLLAGVREPRGLSAGNGAGR